MSQTKTVRQDIKPYFDLEAFMQMSRETRVGGATLERLMAFWEKWMALLNVYTISTENISWLIVWLPQEVEETVDDTWGKSASDGFLVNNLAQFMCMSVIQELLPQVEDGGCAPSPRPTAILRETLTGLGIPYKNENSSLLSRRYAVLTHYPYKGGCEICHMQSHCPKGQGQAESAGVLLPGYEQGEQEGEA